MKILDTITKTLTSIQTILVRLVVIIIALLLLGGVALLLWEGNPQQALQLLEEIITRLQ